MKRIALLWLAIASGGLAYTQTVDSLLLKKHVFTLASDSLMGRGFGLKGGRMAASYIETEFEKAGILPWGKKYKHAFIKEMLGVKVEGANIIGWVEGSDTALRDEFILVGAHYDHLGYRMKGDSMVVYNGADDNASGVASIIEIGRWLAANRNRLKRSVLLVAFDGEEAGLIGSTHLVRKLQIPVNRVKAALILDMVGMLTRYGGIDLVGDGLLEDGKSFLRTVAMRHGISVKKDGKKLELRTDTAPFGNVGIPAIHVFTSTISPYHRPEDDAFRLDYPGMARIASFVADVAAQLSRKTDIGMEKRLKKRMLSHKRGVSSVFFGGLGEGYTDYPDRFFRSKDKLNYEVGLMAELPITLRVSVLAEFAYASRAATHQYGNLRTHELTFPLSLTFMLTPVDKSDMARILFFAGGYYSYRFSGKVGSRSMDFESGYRREDYGLCSGVAFEVMGVWLRIFGYRSLVSIDRSENILSKGYTISLGFGF